MSELFREIEEDIKQEKFEKLWRSFGRVMVLASIGLVALTVVFVLWQNNSQTIAETKTDQLLHGIDIMEIENYSGAIPVFSAIADGASSPYYGIAMLNTAQAQNLSGDVNTAKKTYAELAKSNASNPNYVFAGIAQLKGQIEEVPETSPFYHSLLEYKAWQLLNDGKKTEALDIFSRLANDEKSPQTLAERTQEVLRTLAPEKSISEKTSEKLGK
jgi:hypothetical protein